MREHATQNTGAGCPRVPEGPWQRDRDTRDNRGMPWWLRMWEKVGRMSCRGFGDKTAVEGGCRGGKGGVGEEWVRNWLH